MFKSSVKIAAAAAMFVAAGKTGSADVWSCEDWPAQCASYGHEPGLLHRLLGTDRRLTVYRCM